MFVVDSDAGGSPVKMNVAKPAMSSALHHYQCRFCDHSSACVRRIREHVMSLHLNYKPYSCVLCNYRTVRQYSVAMHMLHRHCNVSRAERLCCFNHDAALETKVLSGYYSASVDQFAEKGLGLQDHTYNAVSLAADTQTASNVCHNSNSVQSHSSTKSPGNGALRITLFQKKKIKPRLLSSRPNFYRCKHCTFLASNRKYLNIHVSKKHRTLELKCLHCDASKHERCDIFIHWYTNHEHLPFRYKQIVSDGAVVVVRTPAARVRTMIDKYLHTLSEFDNDQSTVPETKAPSGEADTGIGGENTPVEVDDIIYCCETCPSSFLTPEALSLHKCTSSTQQVIL